MQAWGLESDPWNPQDGGREEVSLQMSMTATHMLWYTRALTDTSNTHTHRQIY